jgi:hypothetical protein
MSDEKAERKAKWVLIAGVVLAFAILILAWTSLIIIANDNPAKEVPLETEGEQ